MFLCTYVMLFLDTPLVQIYCSNSCSDNSAATTIFLLLLNMCLGNAISCVPKIIWSSYLCIWITCALFPQSDACLLSQCGIHYLLWIFRVQRTLQHCSHIESNFILNFPWRYYHMFSDRMKLQVHVVLVCVIMAVVKCYHLTSTPWTLHHCAWNIWWINGVNLCQVLFTAVKAAALSLAILMLCSREGREVHVSVTIWPQWQACPWPCSFQRRLARGP